MNEQKEIKGAIIRGYMRRGLLQIAFSETADYPERRVSYDKMRVLFVVPWEIVENEEKWRPSKQDFKDAAYILNLIRKGKADQIREARAKV